MTVSKPAQPRNVTLVVSILAGVTFLASNALAPFFTACHIVSALLSLAAPVSFVLIGRARRGRPDLLRRGGVLLCLACVPMLIANALYLSYGSAEGSAGDIGGFAIMMMGWAALIITSVVHDVGSPLD